MCIATHSLISIVSRTPTYANNNSKPSNKQFTIDTLLSTQRVSAFVYLPHRTPQLKEDENNKFRLETSKLVKSKELLTKKFLVLEMAKTALDQEVTKLKGILLNMEKEQDVSRKIFDRTKNQIDNITRERDLVRKELQKITKLNDDIHEQNILHEQQIRNLENELKQCSASLQRQREVIKKLERDRDRMGDDNQQLVEKMDKCRGKERGVGGKGSGF